MYTAIEAGLRELRGGLVRLGRLNALALLGEARIGGQAGRARAAVLRLEQARAVDALLGARLGRESESVGGSPLVGPSSGGLLCAGAVNLPAVELLLAATVAGARRASGALMRMVEAPLVAPVQELVAAIEDTLPATTAPAVGYGGDAVGPSPRQAARGPEVVPIDPTFRGAYSLLDLGRDPTLSGEVADRGPYYWSLSSREVAAAQVCALCIVEYDGLPLDFHADLARQCWDEVRHAAFFLSIGVELVPDFLAAAGADHPLLAFTREHVAVDSGLPVPLDGSIYPMMLDATLEQRLVLLHLDAEAANVHAFAEQARSPFSQARPHLARGLEIVTQDEAAHARLGRRWLAWLEPDRERREGAIAAARALRGFLQLSGMFRSRRDDLPEALRRLSAHKPHAV